MKKEIFLLLIFTAFIFCACSNEDDKVIAEFEKEVIEHEGDIFLNQSVFGVCTHDTSYTEPVVPNGIYYPYGDESYPYYLEITDNKYLQYKVKEGIPYSLLELAEQEYVKQAAKYPNENDLAKDPFIKRIMDYEEKTEFIVITNHAQDVSAIWTEWSDFPHRTPESYIGEKYVGEKMFREVYVMGDGVVRMRDFFDRDEIIQNENQANGSENSISDELDNSITTDNLTQIIGRIDSNTYVLSDTIINKFESFSIDCDPIASNNKIMSELSDVLYQVSLMQDSYIYQKDGCFISKYGVKVANLRSPEPEYSVHYFIFTDELEEVGELIYFNVNGKWEYDPAFRSTDIPGTSEITKILSSNPDKQYAVFSVDTGFVFLDEDTNILGSGRNRVKMEGECWDSECVDNMKVKYSEIINIDNLEWIEMKN